MVFEESGGVSFLEHTCLPHMAVRRGCLRALKLL